jgi:hypothetical protein
MDEVLIILLGEIINGRCMLSFQLTTASLKVYVSYGIIFKIVLVFCRSGLKPPSLFTLAAGGEGTPGS